MPATVVLGAQWGDEGKGKIVDALMADHEIAVRFNGGNNAGHTLIVDGKRQVIHLLPSGILREGAVNIVGPGVALDLPVAARELAIASAHGSLVHIDADTPIILPMHCYLDALREAASGANAIGTTKRGIGPLYASFVERRGLSVRDLVMACAAEELQRKLEAGGTWSEWCGAVKGLPKLSGTQAIAVPDCAFDLCDAAATAQWLFSYREHIVSHMADTRALVAQALVANRNVLFEGAQGVMLDVFHGSRPFCTSSSCTLAAVSATFGVYEFDRVIGVAKAYVTRVGAGPFPTELHCKSGEALRMLGGEYGATTGRSRRCGWLDLPALRHAVRVGGIREIALTKLDVLQRLSEVRVCREYAGASSPFDTLTTDRLASAQPIYTPVDLPSELLAGHRQLDDLPEQVRHFLLMVEQEVGVPIRILGTGPGRHQLIR